MDKTDSLTRKFVEVCNVSDWEVLTDTGWEDIAASNKTIEYDMWELTTNEGSKLKAADNHILMDVNYNEVFLKDALGSDIITVNGTERIISVVPLDYKTNMYDLSVNSYNHTYYTNGLLSHNTTCAAGYLLWYAMFVPDSLILIASNVFDSALEIMNRVRFAYEEIPNHIRAGVTVYNKKTVEFDNGSRIISATTTANTGRGKSVSLLYLDEFAMVEPSISQAFWTSISPTLATGGKCLITSTPNTDEDQFAQIWHDANKLVDNYGNARDVGKNGFRPYFADWSAHPDRDEQWAAEELESLKEDRFAREHLCLGGNTTITLRDIETKIITSVTMKQYFEMCKQDIKRRPI